MEKPSGKGLHIGYIVLAILMLLMMIVSASGKLTQNSGAVHVINEVVGVPMSFFPVLAVCEIAGGLGLVAGRGAGAELGRNARDLSAKL